jgi:hypothetical protein
VNAHKADHMIADKKLDGSSRDFNPNLVGLMAQFNGDKIAAAQAIQDAAATKFTSDPASFQAMGTSGGMKGSVNVNGFEIGVRGAELTNGTFAVGTTTTSLRP